MKFAILSALPLDNPRGGAEVVAARMAQGLRGAGHSVTTIVKPIDLTVGLRGAEVVITHNVRGLGWLLPRRIRRLGLKHVHVLHDIQLIEPSGVVFIKRSHAPVGGIVPWTFMRFVWAHVMRWLWRSPEIIIGPSQWILDVHRQWGFFPKSKFVYLPNPIHSHTLEYGSERQKGRFVFVGQIEQHKGVFDLLAAASQLSTDVRVEFVGDGSALAELKRLATGDHRFVFRGRLAPDDVPRALAGATAVVVPSRCLENAPLTITDALAAGIPVIATRVGGIPELVHDGQNGWLIPPGDIPALMRALLTALETSTQKIESKSPTITDYCQRLRHYLLK